MTMRWIVMASLGLVACAQRAPATSTTASPPVTTASAAPAGSLTPDGRWFARERVFEGTCAPAGSRGGCHTITLRPDGSFTNFLYDAALTGRYEISGSQVKLQANNDPTSVETLVLSPDHRQLGELMLKSAPPAP